MGKKFWFQKSLRRMLVDMHIPDWDERFLKDFSPEHYAEMMRLAKVDTAEIYAGSCLGLCYWPTETGFRHRQLHGRDLLGETIAACRKREINVQIYLNVWNRAAYDAHPEWRIQLYDCKGTVEHTGTRFGLCCPNTGFRQYFLSLLNELNTRYKCSGFWIDMIGNYHYCYCPACRKRFREETPFIEIPRMVNWNDPAWLAYDRCRRYWLDEFAEAIQKTIKNKEPKRTVTLQCQSIMRGRSSGIGNNFLKCNDYFAGDFDGGNVEQSCICKFFFMLSKHHPIEFMTPRCESLVHHTTSRSYDNLLMRSYAAIANQAAFTLIDAIDPRGTLDRRFYETARRLNNSYSRYEPYIDGNSQAVFDVGIYHSYESLVDLEHTPQNIAEAEDHPSWPFIRIHENIVNILQKNHLLFGFVHKADMLEKIPLILLSDCSSLTEEECIALTEYVQNGGRLYASGSTSLYDPEHGKRKDFRLAELFGVHTAGTQTQTVSYIAPTFPNSIPGATADYPLMLDHPQIEISSVSGAEILGTLTLPISDAAEQNHFGSAISDPPMIATPVPALVRHRYGKGEVLYAAGMIENIPLDCHRSIFATLLKYLLSNRTTLETNAPKQVECTLFDQPEQKRFIFSCLNQPVELPVQPLHDLNFQLRLPEHCRITQVLLAPKNHPCPFSLKNGILTLKLEQLKDFALFVLKYQKKGSQ